MSVQIRSHREELEDTELVEEPALRRPAARDWLHPGTPSPATQVHWHPATRGLDVYLAAEDYFAREVVELAGEFAARSGLESPPYPFRTEAEVAERFQHLADSWRQATRFASTVAEISSHPAYTAIVGLGPQAVPHILRALVTSLEPWFVALVAITGHDTAKGEDSPEAARQAWIRWGIRQGFID